ncbi:Transposase domain-containing protein [Mycena sanguinolenta]|uniref:Transposase domain-containing protein n=1 Tax=Mycena sanguinolenta TaxID=230812 RepID=A0A8H6XJZ9_9AGAR|nr:Transposase domain-containing protein [Mycena sanguinolenta]
MPGVPLAPQLRERIVAWRYEQRKPVDEIAELAGCSESTVYEILRNYRDFGQTNNPYAQRRGRPRALDMGDISYLSSVLDANPTLYLDEIQELLWENREVDVTLSTLSRALKQIAIMNKFVTREAVERDEMLRATWQAVHGDIPMEYFVWLDESSVDNRTHQRTSGWAGIGRACVRRETFIRGQRFSMLPALSCDGIIALDIFEGSVNKERFLGFLEKELAPKLTPYPGPRSVVVLDNCAIHHDEEVRRIVKVECAKVIYLPPYSPDFNPIEQAFSTIKAWLRRHEAEALNRDARPWLIHQAAMAVSSDDAEGWIINCGYS